MKETFDKWFNDLTGDQQKEILDHIFNKHIKSLNEGFFTGPVGKLEKGLFTGPVASSDRPNVCPTCKRPI